MYFQHGAQINQESQNIDIIFGEKNNNHQIGNVDLEFDVTVGKNDTTKFHYNDPIPLVNNALAFSFKEARLSTTIGSDIEHNKFCGPISSFMRVISNRDGDFLSEFDNFNENDISVLERLADIPPHILTKPQQKMLINSHTDPNKGKSKGYLSLEDIVGFCKSFKEVTINLGFHLMFKTINLQDITYTSMAADMNVKFNRLYLYVSNFDTCC